MSARRFLTTVCVALSLLLLVAIPAQAAVCLVLADGSITCPPGTEPGGPGPAVPTGENPAGARRLLDLANQERAAAGLAPLTSRPDLVSLALEHTLGLVNADSLFHNLDLLGRPLRALLGASVVGENVGWSTDIDDLHDRLMASPLHRANILDPRFSVVGMAVVGSDDGKFYATQDFAQPEGGAPAPAAPAAAAPAAPAAPPEERPSAPAASASQPAPSSTLPTVAKEPATTKTTVAPSPPSLADLTPAGQPDPTQVTAVGDVASLVSMAPVAADGSTGRGVPVFFAVALAAVVALADGAWLVRDRRLTRS